MSNDAAGQPFYPVVSWDISPLSEHDAIVLRAECLDMTTMATHKTHFIAFNRTQVQSMIADMSKALAKLDALQAKAETLTA